MILGVSDHPSFEGSLTEFLSFASSLKVGLVELKLDRIELLPTLSSMEEMRKIRDVLETFSFRYLVHAPYIGVNLASLNPAIREASRGLVSSAIKFANFIDARLVVSHVGRLSRDYPERLVERAVGNAASALTSLQSLSEDLGVTFTIENDHRSGDRVLAGTPEQIRPLLEEVGCRLTFDVGHANTLGRPEEFLESLRDYVVNVHLHDNDGVGDSHLPLGRGNVNLKGVFTALGGSLRDIPLIIECHSFADIRESLKVVRSLI